MSGGTKGMFVGFLNTIAVALCIAWWVDDAPFADVFTSILLVGFLFGVLVGALLGHHAESQRGANRGVMLISMIALTCGVVAFLGEVCDLTSVIPIACVPTIASCIALERWTRHAPDLEVPLARVA